MKLSGAVIHYLLAREFDGVATGGSIRRVKVGYPILFEPSSDMGGHVVLVPEHERPTDELLMEGSLCVCMGERAARSARESGLAVIEVLGDATFARLYNSLQSMFMTAEVLDARLHAYVDSLAGFQPLLDACVATVGFACAIVDAQYRIVYASSPDVPGAAASAEGRTGKASTTAGLLDSEAVDLFMASRDYRHARQSRRVFVMPGASGLLMKNLFAAGDLVGTLVMRFAENHLSARYVRFILEYLAPIVEDLYSRFGSFDLPATGPGRVRHALEGALAGNAADVVRLQAALAEDGHDVRAAYAVLHIERSFTNEGPEEHDYLARRFESSWPRSYCFTENDGLCMLADVGGFESGEQDEFFRELPIVARENLSKVGVSGLFVSMAGLTAACAQAADALKCGNALDPTRWCYRFGDYALDGLLMRMRGDDPSSLITHPALEVLDAHDDHHGDELGRTLEVFMRNRYNATAAADELFVARSTLLNRLTRVRELTGIDLDDPEERLYLLLSLALRDLEARLGSSSQSV